MRKDQGGEQTLSVKVAPFGPNQATLDVLAREVLAHPLLQEHVKNARHRLLSLELADDDAANKARQRPAPPSRFVATVYDYNNGRVIRAAGRLGDLTRLEVSVAGDQPLPSVEEFDAAVQILQQDPVFGPAIKAGHLRAYQSVPPLIHVALPDGRIERTLAVGLAASATSARHEIVGVNMIHQTVVRFDGGAPPTSMAGPQTCGRPAGFQATAQNVAGQVWITVSQGGTVLWKFLVVRPAATSGPGNSTNGTGIELRYVDYRGKRVLYRAHVPILNVKYDNNACGPYRDWQNQEGMVQANGADVAPGFRLSPTPVTTILDTGSDTGNFLGVGIYVQGQEVVLVSKMQAGWYRYISEWRLNANGAIRPRFGFSAVNTSSCVCNRHHHHAYWRLDFDIVTPGNNTVQEYNDPPIIAGSNWHTKHFEIQRPRDPAHKRKWRVSNASTGDAYDIIPGAMDGVATTSPDWPFPVGDVWVLHYHPNEIDDGVVAIGPPYEAGLNPWVNGELVEKQDVVIWYGIHVTHDVKNEPPGSFGHITGPELKPAKW